MKKESENKKLTNYKQESVETNFIEKAGQIYDKEIIQKLLKSGLLTEIQMRRFKKYTLGGYSIREIAEEENVNPSAVFKSINYANKKYKNIFDLSNPEI